MNHMFRLHALTMPDGPPCVNNNMDGILRMFSNHTRSARMMSASAGIGVTVSVPVALIGQS